MRKIQTATKNVVLLLLFYIEKIIFYWKTYLQKLSLYCFTCVTVSSCDRLLEMQ